MPHTAPTDTDKLLDPRLDAVARQFLSGQDIPDTEAYQTNFKQTIVGDLCSERVSPAMHHSPKAQRREASSSIPIIHQSREDDDKYKRRVALGWVARWFK